MPPFSQMKKQVQRGDLPKSVTAEQGSGPEPVSASPLHDSGFWEARTAQAPPHGAPAWKDTEGGAGSRLQVIEAAAEFAGIRGQAGQLRGSTSLSEAPPHPNRTPRHPSPAPGSPRRCRHSPPPVQTHGSCRSYVLSAQTFRSSSGRH